jgi:hypothetical protein
MISVEKNLKSQKQESPVVAMFVNGSGRNEETLQRVFHRCFLPNFCSFGQAVSEKIFTPQVILVSDFLDSSPLKSFGQMNRNLVGSIYGKSSVAIAHFVPIH